jgi:hypothetical protein
MTLIFFIEFSIKHQEVFQKIFLIFIVEVVCATSSEFQEPRGCGTDLACWNLHTSRGRKPCLVGLGSGFGSRNQNPQTYTIT